MVVGLPSRGPNVLLHPTCLMVASHADVLRLVTRSSPSGEERVTSLRTSAWEASLMANL